MQEIIVYGNPAEAAIWHSLMENPGLIFIVIMVALASWLIIWYGLTAITGKGKWRNDGGGWIMPVAFIGSILSSIAVVWFWG